MARVSGISRLLITAALPFLLLVSVVLGILGIGRNRDRSAKEVADFLQNFLDGSGGEWDWDDFTSVPIKDPALESIRFKAEMVQLPMTEAGFEELRQLLGQVEKMVAENHEIPVSR